MPADHGVWLDDDQHVRPAGPEPGQDEPESTVDRVQARASSSALEVGQLLAEGEVLQKQVLAGLEGGAQRAKESQEEAKHGDRLSRDVSRRQCWLRWPVTDGESWSRMASWRTTGPWGELPRLAARPARLARFLRRQRGNRAGEIVAGHAGEVRRHGCADPVGK